MDTTLTLEFVLWGALVLLSAITFAATGLPGVLVGLFCAVLSPVWIVVACWLADELNRGLL